MSAELDVLHLTEEIAQGNPPHVSNLNENSPYLTAYASNEIKKNQ